MHYLPAFVMVAQTEKRLKMSSGAVFRVCNRRKWIDHDLVQTGLQQRDNGEDFDLTGRVSVLYYRNEDSKEDEYDLTLIRRANPISEGETIEDSDIHQGCEQNPFDMNRWISSLLFKFIGKNSNSSGQ